jgi:hypothetical protein
MKDIKDYTDIECRPCIYKLRKRLIAFLDLPYKTYMNLRKKRDGNFQYYISAVLSRGFGYIIHRYYDYLIKGIMNINLFNSIINELEDYIMNIKIGGIKNVMKDDLCNMIFESKIIIQNKYRHITGDWIWF